MELLGPTVKGPIRDAVGATKVEEGKAGDWSVCVCVCVGESSVSVLNGTDLVETTSFSEYFETSNLHPIASNFFPTPRIAEPTARLMFWADINLSNGRKLVNAK